VIAEIKKKINQLGNEKLRLQGELDSLRNKYRDLEERVQEQRVELDEQSEKNRVLKMAKSLNGSGEDTAQTKKKINELVREIDKCIALLNK